MSSDKADTPLNKLMARDSEKVKALFNEPRYKVECFCGNTWSQALHTVCPKCFAWPKSPYVSTWTANSDINNGRRTEKSLRLDELDEET